MPKNPIKIQSLTNDEINAKLRSNNHVVFLTEHTVGPDLYHEFNHEDDGQYERLSLVAYSKDKFSIKDVKDILTLKSAE